MQPKVETVEKKSEKSSGKFCFFYREDFVAASDTDKELDLDNQLPINVEDEFCFFYQQEAVQREPAAENPKKVAKKKINQAESKLSGQLAEEVVDIVPKTARRNKLSLNKTVTKRLYYESSQCDSCSQSESIVPAPSQAPLVLTLKKVGSEFKIKTPNASTPAHVNAPQFTFDFGEEDVVCDQMGSSSAYVSATNNSLPNQPLQDNFISSESLLNDVVESAKQESQNFSDQPLQDKSVSSTTHSQNSVRINISENSADISDIAVGGTPLNDFFNVGQVFPLIENCESSLPKVPSLS
jgi:hypothetical protein